MLAGDGNQVEARPVRTGEWLGTDWVILDGLERGDRVIVDHLMQVHPGVAVEPHVAEPAAESATAPPHGDDGARAEPTRARDAKS